MNSGDNDGHREKPGGRCQMSAWVAQVTLKTCYMRQQEIKMVGFNVDWIGMDTHMAVASSEGLSYFVCCVNALGSSLFGKLAMDF